MTRDRCRPRAHLFTASLICFFFLLTSGAPAQARNVEGTYRNFNVLSKDADGQLVSRSIVSTYTLTPTEYVEATLFHILVRGQDALERFVHTLVRAVLLRLGWQDPLVLNA